MLMLGVNASSVIRCHYPLNVSHFTARCNRALMSAVAMHNMNLNTSLLVLRFVELLLVVKLKSIRHSDLFTGAADYSVFESSV